MRFKDEHSFEDRLKESTRIMKRYSDRVPVICEKANKSKLADIDKSKYLVPMELSMGQFIYVIRKRMVLPPEKAIFLFINGKMVPSGSTMCNIYDTEKDADGFLYVSYAEENVFGSDISTK